MATLSGVVATPSTQAAGAVPVPEEDPFYAVPANVADYDNGEVISFRPITPKAFEIPLPAQGWQVLYRTEDRVGRPTATVTTVLVPDRAWKGAGPRPLLSYQTAEDGVAGKCAPSYAFSAGVRGGLTNAYPELGLVAMALLRGWAVSVPDYEGPQSQFLVAGVQAKGVLDGIRAARSFAPAAIDPAAPIGLWGYSGGSLASLTAAQFQPTYAPELRLSALALGGLVANVRATIDAFDGSVFGGAIPMGINGFLRGYPELGIGDYLNESGRALVAKAAGDCINDAVARRPFLTIAQMEAVPHALDQAPIAAMLRENSPLFMPGVPEVPIYHYHAKLDELAPIGPARAVLRRFCAAGVDVESHETALGEHLTEVGRGAAGAMQFLARRFGGKAPRNTCAKIPG
ncbi:lipase [Nocardioides humilatus]|uniref:Lipase n=2 Tax=Nocardioides humilatus TaxID=2607660 RepID=A0A5B1LB19_9ACTN|nr:lipase [Nocardioides humilatus]